MKMEKVEWDYSERAAFYDKRADYSSRALDQVFVRMALPATATVADIGAGTGKLSRPLAQRGFNVLSVEPNDAMRSFGIANTRNLPVQWSVGTGERTGLKDRSVAAAFFGSSFNVVDQQAALTECGRILVPRGWFCCMWNHRDLDDPGQARIEEIIKRAIPGYDYGTRREDPTRAIEDSRRFGSIFHVEGTFAVDMPVNDVIEAWKSHATLARQAGAGMDAIITEIRASLPKSGSARIPYTTRIWFAQLSG
jgi:ubiquinone/menaquinone biosynthesis C-methylase UbiE